MRVRLFKWLKLPLFEVIGASIVGAMILKILGIDGWIAFFSNIITILLYVVIKKD